ncbi:TOMM precursor leader peptide-binding protein [Vitiosangium sp. GDMCC 1.1324]|uniref:TOMM precursor leader peptide-binding protein n=1 Tax=Vitiosangium sp. (strain GDMCC 1.1324) TaxID=2138576 RepID=UPI000D3AC616|nr:TOMM precursor leader peptide-binding protein [Vitiosangium sp. GDMCC 1.1324]PTL78726.1 bacteriocin biosynthesis protein SagD [Vitiosangium sp. GDMCC 1.1324]
MSRLLVAGEGELRERLQAALADLPLASLEPGTEAASGDCVLLVLDTPLPGEELEWQRRCRAAGASLLPVRVDGSELLVGPWVPPAGPGCVACLEHRRQAIQPLKTFRRVNEAAAQWARKHGKSHPWLNPIARGLAEERIRVELDGWRQGTGGELRNRVWFIELSTSHVSEHSFLPFPRCPVCGELPEDSAGAVQPPRASIPKPDRLSLRVPERPLELGELRRRFVDHRTGLIANEYVQRDNEVLALAVSELPLDFRDQREPGIGRCNSFAQSEFTALLEALERYAGLRPMGKRTVVRGSYRQLAPQAIDPAELILHAPEQYTRPGFPFVPYSPDLEFNWVWGYSFRRREPVLVPEQSAYYRLVDLTREPNRENLFAFEISNGCALGGCLEEAILHGLFEVAERDGFLMTWYARLSAPRVDLHSFGDPELELMLDRLESRGFQVHAFNTTYDLRIPSFWVMAVNQRGEGLQTYSAGGAHMDPLKAVHGGLSEVAAGVFDFVRIYPKERERLLTLAEHPEKVRTMRDHALLFGLPELRSRLDFLLDSGRPVQTAREAFPEWYAKGPSTDLARDLEGCVRHFLDSGCDVIAVEQTPPELRQVGVRSVKVLATGSLTMTFGHDFTRLHGATRLSTVPVSFGYRAPGELFPINSFPHPFP